jgi:hypothetical protein
MTKVQKLEQEIKKLNREELASFRDCMHQTRCRAPVMLNVILSYIFF